MNSKETESSSHINLLLNLFDSLWRQQPQEMRKKIIYSLMFLFFGKLVTIVIPFFLKIAVDLLSSDDEIHFWLPLGLVIAYGTARFASQLFNEFRDIFFVRVSQGTQRAILVSTFAHLHELSLRFHLSRQTGAVSRIIERGTRGMQFTFQFMTFNILPTLLEIILVTTILLVSFKPLFAIVTLCTVIAYVAYTLIITEKRTPYRKEMNKHDAAANNAMVESLLNYETVKYFGNEEHERKNYKSLLEAYEEAAVKTQKLSAILNSGQAAIIALGLITVMGLAVDGVVDKSLSIGDFILVNTFLIQLYLPLNILGFVYREIKQGLIDLGKTFELRDTPPEIIDKDSPLSLPKPRGRISFEDVSFSYDKRRPILKSISFMVEPGKTVAIVGPSGSGKSTIARLLYRFFDIGSGAIKIDGVDIRDLRQAELRSLIGIVPQDTVLFNRTIRYNIEYGKIGATQEEIEKASRLAHIHEFITSLPDGYDTTVGERGLKLSGGEKQRTALARMILKDPRIIVLDEATSALDSHTEDAIQEALKEAVRGRTALVIAHRLSTIVDADLILVVRKGHIVEQGSHVELCQAGGVYQALWERQIAHT
jgi:ATP-binding cassette, subfamily B, heavy metal transporter